MTKREIVETLAKMKTVERIVKNLGSGSPYEEDLAQDIYEDLMKKKDDLIVSLWENGDITFFIIRMAKNNMNSKTSPYYTKYEKFRKTTQDIDEEKREDTDY